MKHISEGMRSGEGQKVVLFPLADPVVRLLLRQDLVAPQTLLLHCVHGYWAILLDGSRLTLRRSSEYADSSIPLFHIDHIA